jgi:hypothetical protein
MVSDESRFDCTAYHSGSRQNLPYVVPLLLESPLITFYYNLAPNPMKVALCLEEMGLRYELKPVDTRKGEQHQPDFLAINPNGKVPVIID